MLFRLFLALAACFLVSCRTTAPQAVPQPLLPRWQKTAACDAASGPVRIDVSLASKTQLLTKDGALLAEMDVSPGVPEHETPMGDFRVTEKLPLKRSNLYGQYVQKETREVIVHRAWEHEGPAPEGTEYQGIAMPWWLRLTDDGVGIHVGGFERGQPTSHGCIRCLEEAQKLFYDKTKIGTPVSIHEGKHPVPSVLEVPAVEEP
jgi:lipoprotein-anchoring transpeptidase ErfK/SrfK